MIGEAISTGALSKLSKDELYTFIFGFSLGLIYFLTICTCFSQGKIQLIFESDFHAAIVLVAFGLIGSLVLYLVYLPVGFDTTMRAQAKLNDKNSGSFEFDIQQPRPLTTILYYNVSSILNSQVHLFQLFICSLILLLPAIWIWILRLTITACAFYYYSILFLLIVLVVYCVNNLIYERIVLKMAVDSWKYHTLVNNRMIKITYNPDEYAEGHNRAVDDKYKDLLDKIKT